MEDVPGSGRNMPTAYAVPVNSRAVKNLQNRALTLPDGAFDPSGGAILSLRERDIPYRRPGGRILSHCREVTFARSVGVADHHARDFRLSGVSVCFRTRGHGISIGSDVRPSDALPGAESRDVTLRGRRPPGCGLVRGHCFGNIEESALKRPVRVLVRCGSGGSCRRRIFPGGDIGAVHVRGVEQQPVGIDLREAAEDFAEEVEAWFVSLGEDVGDDGRTDVEEFGQLPGLQPFALHQFENFGFHGRIFYKYKDFSFVKQENSTFVKC